MLLRRFWRSLWAIPITWPQIRDLLFRLAKLLILVLVVLGIVFIIVYLESYVMGESWGGPQDFIKALRESGILSVLESVTIITGVILFIFSGAQQERKNSQYLACIVLDIAGKRKTSYARIQALQELNKDGFSLAESNLRDANLRGIQLEDADFSFADLNNVNFESAYLNGTSFWGAKLDKANFTLARLKRADFYNANLQEAKFGRGRLHNAFFKQTNLSGSDFSRAELEKADFTDANLKNGNFSSANLQRAIFKGADLESVVFKNSRIDFSDFRGAIKIPVQEIISAQGWRKAKFDPDISNQLIALAASQTN